MIDDTLFQTQRMSLESIALEWQQPSCQKQGLLVARKTRGRLLGEVPSVVHPIQEGRWDVEFV